MRDKLLNEKSHDIDVALSTMTGLQFAQILQKFIQDGKAVVYEEKAKRLQLKAELGSIHKIAANPEKSKHLETVTTRMFGLDVDFVNLRKEVYDEVSRNPQMEFGTPQEDALRRDATINALFYNLHTEQVEDFTGKGLHDMESKLIRTPLAPYQTFKDDPLRILRLIRFASRLGYTIERESMEAMEDKTIHEALRAKISRERVGIEVQKMMTGSDPHGALMHIYELGLHNTVFADPSDKRDIDHSNLPKIYESLLAFTSSPEPPFDELLFLSGSNRAKINPALPWYLAAYSPWERSAKEAIEAVQKGIKPPKELVILIGDSVKNLDAVRKMVRPEAVGRYSRSQLGMFIKDLGPSWRLHILYAMLCDLAHGSCGHVREKYHMLIIEVQQKGLLGAAETVCILRGNKIQEAMDSKQGPWMTDAIRMVFEWQFDHRDGSEEDALRMIKGRKDELGLS